jgi:pimeloyl-ACP methyl ester carboxylesterase
VLLEAGMAASSVSWRLVQEPLSHECRVISYDRAGFSWSPEAATPRTIPNLVDELKRMLDECGVEGPFVFVGHSFGGLLLRHFTARHRELVRALVLVDPLEPCEWSTVSEKQLRLMRLGVRLARRAAVLARFGFVRFGIDLLLAGGRFVPRVVARVGAGSGGGGAAERLVGEIRKLPKDAWPAVCSHWCQPGRFRTMAEYVERLPEFCSAPVDNAALREIPLVVVSASKNAPHVIEAHRRTAACSERGRHMVAENCGHWIQFDRPEIVLEAIRAVRTQ